MGSHLFGVNRRPTDIEKISCVRNPPLVLGLGQDSQSAGIWYQVLVQVQISVKSCDENVWLTLMKVTRTRLTDDEKAAWSQFCRASRVSESKMLRMMIRKVSGCAPHTVASSAESKSEKVTIRLAPGDFKKMDGMAQEEGYLNRTSWTAAVVLAALHREPVLSDEEIKALRQSCRELGAIGRNLNQVARALNVEFRESDRIKREEIEDLSGNIDEHRALVLDLLDKNMNRWR